MKRFVRTSTRRTVARSSVTVILNFVCMQTDNSCHDCFCNTVATFHEKASCAFLNSSAVNLLTHFRINNCYNR